jgi:hypothetical protein
MRLPLLAACRQSVKSDQSDGNRSRKSRLS